MKIFTLCALPVLLALACDSKEPTVDPDGGGAAETGDTEAGTAEDPGPAVVPQDPDPPELAQALKSFILGDMAAVIAATQPLMESLGEPSQARAQGIAAALFALASAEDVAENAEEPARKALANAAEVRDAEVEQLGHIALAAYLVGVEDGAAAQAEAQAATGLDGPNGALAQLYLGQALLSQAYEGDKLAHPEKLDEAIAAYQAAVDASEDAAIKGRGTIALASLAKLQGKRDAICDLVRAAKEHYATAGASDYLTEVPTIIGDEAKCK